MVQLALIPIFWLNPEYTRSVTKANNDLLQEKMKNQLKL